MADAPFRPYDDHLDEGDILANVPFAVWRGDFWDVKPDRGIITSHGCACEDYDRAIEAGHSSKARRVTLHVAPIRSLSGQPDDKLQLIRDGKVWRYFYVYGDNAALADQVVDLDAEQAIPASALVSLPKIARLASWQWKRLIIHVTVNRWGLAPEDIFGSLRARELRDHEA